MSARSIPIVGFAAFSGSGKTTLVSGVIPVLCERGLRVGVIKHAHHNFTIDTPGKDSYELRSAGAEQVLIASKQRTAWVRELTQDQEPELEELLEFYAGQNLDLIIVEGFKHGQFTKIEVHRSSIRRPLLASNDSHIIAIATDSPESIDVDVETLDLDNYSEIAEFITKSMARGALTLAFAES